MISLRAIQFATPWALVLLLLIPLWWVLRRRMRSPSITFSRTGDSRARAAYRLADWRSCSFFFATSCSSALSLPPRDRDRAGTPRT